jgi:hypothetical protein
MEANFLASSSKGAYSFASLSKPSTVRTEAAESNFPHVVMFSKTKSVALTFDAVKEATISDISSSSMFQLADILPIKEKWRSARGEVIAI